MGAWGYQPFDNDAAHDWSDDARSPAAIDGAFSKLSAAGGVDADAAQHAIAAVAVIAAAIDGDVAGLPENVIDLAKRIVVDAAIRARTLAALDAVADAKSELRQLWDESAHAARWHESIAALRRRLAR